MYLEVQSGQLRLWSHLGGYLFAAVVFYQSCGWLGVAALGVLSQRYRRQWLSQRARIVSLQPGYITAYWRLPFVLACRSNSRWSWLFIDEVTPAEWSRVRRFAVLHLPAQPVGLSISR